MKKLLRIFTLLSLLPLFGMGQEAVTARDTSLKIQYVVTDSRIPGYLDIHLRLILGDTVPNLKFLEDSLMFHESRRGRRAPLETQKVIPQRYDVITVITDVSSSMWRVRNGHTVYMDTAKSIVDTLLTGLRAPYAIDLFTYDEILYRKTLSGENSMGNVRRPAEARYTHLYENVDAALGRMKDSKGRKILIIIGDGENDHNKKLPVKITRQDLLDKIRGLDESYFIFPIAIGPKLYELNFQQLVAATENKEDSVIHGWPGADLYNLVASLDNWPVTHTILAKSNLHPHAGEVRSIDARLEHRRDTSEYRLGGLFNPWHEESNFQLDSFVGGLLIFLVFVVFAFFIPRQRWKDFKKKYIKHYWEVKKEGIRQYDPLTKFPFRDDDLVVVRCEHMTSLETWQYEGRRAGRDSSNRKRKNRCIYYPNKCESGTGPGGSTDFFTQVGSFKYLFWGFLGAMAGFCGWAFWAVFETSKNVRWNAWLNEIAAWPTLQKDFGVTDLAIPVEDSILMVRERFLNAFGEQILIGTFAVVVIVFAIAIANEMSQARGSFRGTTLLFGILQSLARSLVAGIVAAAVFAGFGWLQGYVFLERPYLPGLLAMLLLGVLIGRILTVRSGIRHLRGLFAGLAAGCVAFHVYFLPMLIFQTPGYEMPKMIAWIVFGFVIGFILSRGAPALENSEMEVWTGRKQYGKNHITDLLRKNEDVTIGRGPTATVRMKVRYTYAHNAPANITQTFAQLTLRNEVVYLIPEIFTEVNGEPVAPNERIPLFDGDRISFRHKSPSHLRYVEGRAGVHPRWRKKRRLAKRRAKAKAKAMRDKKRASGAK